ncbi:hypothetical protein BH11BAC4_BH11BAC4_21720 [soil metagenome]
MRKKITRSVLIILFMLSLIAVAHFVAFPEETRCILIPISNFEKTANIYFSKNTPTEKISHLQEIQNDAGKRVAACWKNELILDYKLVYCNSEKDFDQCGHAGAPAATQLKCGAYIVLKEESLNKDIIAHEIAHTVLYRNIGWYRLVFKIPTWFNEGLAMQVDERDYYSIDTLLSKKNKGILLPDVTKLSKPQEFFAGDHEAVILNYSTAKFVVHAWLKTHSLKKFIREIKNGKSFEVAYEQE